MKFRHKLTALHNTVTSVLTGTMVFLIHQLTEINLITGYAIEQYKQHTRQNHDGIAEQT